MKNQANKTIGIILIIIGVIFALNALNLLQVNIFFPGWWTLIIIIPCLIGLVNNRNMTSNIIGILIGIALLLAENKVITYTIIWKLALPTILVIIGLSLLFKDSITAKIKNEMKKVTPNDEEYCTTFSEQNIDLENEDFKGCTIDSIFGKTKVDLRKANIKKDCIIKNSSVFGYTEIKVPDNVNVKISNTSIFGETKNKKTNNSNNKITIYVSTTCLFGGVEIDE